MNDTVQNMRDTVEMVHPLEDYDMEIEVVKALFDDILASPMDNGIRALSSAYKYGYYKRGCQEMDGQPYKEKLIEYIDNLGADSHKVYAYLWGFIQKRYPTDKAYII